MIPIQLRTHYQTPIIILHNHRQVRLRQPRKKVVLQHHLTERKKKKFSIVWITSYINRTTKVTKCDSVSK